MRRKFLFWLSDLCFRWADLLDAAAMRGMDIVDLRELMDPVFDDPEFWRSIEANNAFIGRLND